MTPVKKVRIPISRRPTAPAPQLVSKEQLIMLTGLITETLVSPTIRSTDSLFTLSVREIHKEHVNIRAIKMISKKTENACENPNL